MPSFTGKVNRFVTYFVDTDGDLKRAALMSSLKLAAAKRLYKDPEVRAECDRRLDKIHDYQAQLRAKAHVLEVNFLDTQLVRAVKYGADRGDIKALELGYRRTGMFRDGEFLGVPRADQQTPKSDAQPMIYRAMERTVTRTEQVTERAELGAEPPQTALPESHNRPPAVVEILQY